MNEQEVRGLLVLAMSYDNRKPGDANVMAWMEQAQRNGWTFTTAREAIHEHYRNSTDFLMPAHITAILKDVRRRIRDQFSQDVHVSPPKELADNPAAEIAWRRRFAEQYTQRALAAWASGREIPALEQPVEPGERDRPQLTAAVEFLASRRALPAAESTPTRPARPAVDRSDQRRARIDRARAELDHINPDEVQARAEESYRRTHREAS